MNKLDKHTQKTKKIFKINLKPKLKNYYIRKNTIQLYILKLINK